MSKVNVIAAAAGIYWLNTSCTENCRDLPSVMMLAAICLFLNNSTPVPRIFCCPDIIFKIVETTIYFATIQQFTSQQSAMYVWEILEVSFAALLLKMMIEMNANLVQVGRIVITTVINVLCVVFLVFAMKQSKMLDAIIERLKKIKMFYELKKIRQEANCCPRVDEEPAPMQTQPYRPQCTPSCN